MQINDSNLLGISQPSTGPTERTGAAPVAKQVAPYRDSAEADAVQLSSFARKINELRDDSPARQARVEQLRSLYLAGKYEIDPAALAQSIVDAHLRG